MFGPRRCKLIRLEFLGQYNQQYDLNHRDKKWFEDDVAKRLQEKSPEFWQIIGRKKNASRSGAVRKKNSSDK